MTIFCEICGDATPAMWETYEHNASEIKWFDGTVSPSTLSYRICDYHYGQWCLRTGFKHVS